MGRESTPTVSVRKKGPGSKKVTEKRALISDFLAKRLDFDYIPAVRTAESAQRVVQLMVERELSSLEEHPDYQQALARIEELQKPILETISTTLRDTLKQFLGSPPSTHVPSPRHAAPPGTEGVSLRIFAASCSISLPDPGPDAAKRFGAARPLLRARRRFGGRPSSSRWLWPGRRARRRPQPRRAGPGATSDSPEPVVCDAADGIARDLIRGVRANHGVV